MVRVTSVEDLLAGTDRAVELVTSGSLSLHVRTLSAKDGVVLAEQLRKAGDDSELLLAAQLAAFLCHEDGTPLLTVDQARVLAARYNKQTITGFIEAGVRMNGFDREAVKGN